MPSLFENLPAQTSLRREVKTGSMTHPRQMGEEGFDSYYKTLYGGRWDGLKNALLKPAERQPLTAVKLPYLMDYASVLAARTLRLPARGNVFDACAAPGGKTLVLAAESGAGVQIIANEFSSERRRRLRNTLEQHLDDKTRNRIRVSGFDAAALAAKKSEHERFDSILLDAPCSSERHLLSNKKYLEKWTPARPRFLAKRQWSLLSAAFLLLKTGGSLVYATCALSFEENDNVAARLTAKYGARARLDPPDFLEGEKTAFGKIILPDTDGGIGPMYVARFTKQAVK
ncbi:MAG: 16S rRNA methyltransferase [Spirochaetaceae bacterium]|nr:16S rRNA methyltransferase [Spirochaetaceae bacterium]